MKLHNNLPPQDIDAEESIIASCLLSKDELEKAVELLYPEDFYRTSHQKIFASIIQLNNKNKNVDLVTLADRLRSNNQLDEIGGAVYLAKLSDTAPVVPNMADYCQIVKNMAIKRRMIVECSEISNSCFDRTIDGISALDSAQQRFNQIAITTSENKAVKLSDLCEDRFDHYEEINNKPSGITGIASGFNKFDRLTGGFQNTDLYILAGRPGMGKTSFALDVALKSSQNNHPVFFVSLEMSKGQLLDRVACKLAGVNSSKLRTGGLTQNDFKLLQDAMGQISSLPFYVCDPDDWEYHSIERSIKRAYRELDIEFVLIDYLQLMVCKGQFNGRKDLEVGAMSRNLKKLAKSLNIPVVPLSQLSRNLESRNDKRPLLSDLRESGQLEQDADLVLFLYRDEIYNKDEFNPDKGTGELIIAKNRHGACDNYKLVFQAETATYKNFIPDGHYRPPHNNQDWD